MKPIRILIFLALSIVLYLPTSAQDESWTMVSFPDFFNFDVPEPWPQWDDAVNWYLDQVERENPDFTLIAGDLVNGHWTEGPKCIEQMGALYYEGWKRRLEQHNLTFYVAVGDHELGDDPWPPEKVELVPHFERVFAQHMQMPDNGPANKKGLSYFIKHKNALIVTVETFEIIEGELIPTVTGEQLEWLKQTLIDHQDADFIIVQGHAPVFGELKSRSSSMLMVQDSTASEFWQVMKNGGVDVYLCGEHHAVTTLEKDGVWQIVHGSSWGRQIVNTMDYLVMQVGSDELRLTMKSFPMEAKGDYMWNLNKTRGPREIVEIPQKVLDEGPQISGELIIKKRDGKKTYSNVKGCFAEGY